jgi:ABC-type sugar transport system ATPase subunit
LIKGPVSNQPLLISIRPESLKIGEKGLSVSITMVENIGRDKLVRFKTTDGQTGLALLDADSEVKTGNTITLSLRDKGIFFFDLSGGRLT